MDTHACPPPPKAEIRGLLGKHGDSPAWLAATARFPNGVPRFDSQQECVDFITNYVQHQASGSNPDSPHLQHIFTTLIGRDQIDRILIPEMNKARKEPSTAPKIPQSYGSSVCVEGTGSKSIDQSPSDQIDQSPSDHSNDNSDHNNNSNNSHGSSSSSSSSSSNHHNKKNIYEQPEARPVVEEIAQRLNVPFHQCLTPASTRNTLHYLFEHMKFGIYVMIRNGTLRIFCPFVNHNEYRNTWGNQLRMEGDGSLDTYYNAKAGLYREEQIEPDRTKWWANGNIICNEPTQLSDASQSQHWGDQFLAALRDMLGEACRERILPDCEFFLNKRDYPQLKVNVERGGGGVPVEPYGFVFDKDDRLPEEDIDLTPEHTFPTYAPIVSFYAAAPDRFTDIPWPSSEDWEAACGLVFPNTFMHSIDAQSGQVLLKSTPRDLFTEANFRKFARGWNEDRVQTAFFRGTATGGGTTLETNQRLKVAHLSHLWKDDPVKGGPEPYLDAQLVGWNLRDKKIAGAPMSFLRAKQFDFSAGREHFTPIYEQSKYKYLVYVDGHCAACRYGFMMRLGSVILKVAPRQVADRMWYFPLLKPYIDHVPVQADLSDLEEKIRWCRAHDDECRVMGENAQQFYDTYVSRNALLDYVQMCCRHMAQRTLELPSWWEPPPHANIPPPTLRKPDTLCYEDRRTDQARLCIRCQEEEDAEQLELEMAKQAVESQRTDRGAERKRLANRMRREAEKAKNNSNSSNKKAKT